jgi:hypothetical protein
MNFNLIAKMINDYGFPIIETTGIAYILYYVWVWTTTKVKPVVSEVNVVLIGLIDRIRLLDNDMIRLGKKVDVVLQLKGIDACNYKEKLDERVDKE